MSTTSTHSKQFLSSRRARSIAKEIDGVSPGERPTGAMAFSQSTRIVAAMEGDDSNVVHLSGLASQGVQQGHKCSFSCSIKHVWANLYLCSTTGTSHVCDKNCDQRIIYDNNSSICRASRKIFPLQPPGQQPIHGMRRKHHHDCESFEASTKRNRCFFSQEHQVNMVGACFSSPYQDMAHSTGARESPMDVV